MGTCQYSGKRQTRYCWVHLLKKTYNFNPMTDSARFLYLFSFHLTSLSNWIINLVTWLMPCVGWGGVGWGGVVIYLLQKQYAHFIWCCLFYLDLLLVTLPKYLNVIHKLLKSRDHLFLLERLNLVHTYTYIYFIYSRK